MVDAETMVKAYNAGLNALTRHPDTFDSLAELVRVVVDAVVPVIERARTEKSETTSRSLRFIQSNRDSLIRALAAQARQEAAEGRGAERGFYDSEVSRAADWLESLLEGR